MSDKYIDIVFKELPTPSGSEGPGIMAFLEVENEQGKSIKIGEWIKRTDGLWTLRLYEDLK